MFDWFFGTPACPIDEETREWVDKSWLWLCDELGRTRARGVDVILPTPEFFPDNYNSQDEKSIRTMFDRVCEYMGCPPVRFHLAIFSAVSQPLRSFASFRPEFSSAAGVYDRNGIDCTIWIEESQLDRPLQLVATMAHELGHEHLLGRERISEEQEDHEPLTDLITVFLGFGVITANANLVSESWYEGGWSGWSVGKQGYLDLRTFGYALALFARLRCEERPSWAKELRPDVLDAMRKAERLLEQDNDPRFR